MKDLKRIIQDNHGCVVYLDSNDWWLYPKLPENYDEMSGDEQEDWETANELANSNDEFKHQRTGGIYGKSYGGDILIVLAEICGVELKGV